MTGTSASYVKFEFFLFILRALQCERFHWTVRFKFSNEITKTEYSKEKTINVCNSLSSIKFTSHYNNNNRKLKRNIL